MIRYALLLLAGAAWAQTPTGRWDGSITRADLRVPVVLFFEGSDAALRASFVNGGQRAPAGAGTFSGGALKLRFDAAGAVLEAKLEGGELTGVYAKDGQASAFRASAYCTCSYEGEAGPDISGEWNAPGVRMTVRREGEDTLVTVTRGGEALGPASGRFNGAFFELAYFDGRRAVVLEIEPRKDGSLDVIRKEPGAASAKFAATRASKP